MAKRLEVTVLDTLSFHPAGHPPLFSGFPPARNGVGVELKPRTCLLPEFDCWGDGERERGKPSPLVLKHLLERHAKRPGNPERQFNGGVHISPAQVR